MRIDDAATLRTKSIDLDKATDVLTEEIRTLNKRLEQTNTTTTVWLMTPATETDPDIPGASLGWMVGYAAIRGKGKQDGDGRVWCLCAKRVRLDPHGAPIEVVRTVSLDSAPRHVRAAAVAVLPKLIKELAARVDMHASAVVRAADALRAFNAGSER